MGSKTPVAIFMAASALLAIESFQQNLSFAAENKGGLTEWTTDQKVDDESKPDKAAKELRKKAKKQNVCIPIGEGENCW